jgi:hypothetical protein
VNLAGIKLFRDGSEVHTQQLQKTDTGKILQIIDAPRDEGFYKYEVLVFDTDGNSSPKSQSSFGYCGEIYSNYFDNFDFSGTKKYIISGDWAKTKDVFFSPEFSFTDSPKGKYPSNLSSEFVIFPFTPQKSSILKFKHIAHVHRTDTAFVEISSDKMKTWKTLGKFNRNSYPLWQDNNLSKDKWIIEFFREPAVLGDTVFVKFRLTTDIIGSDDGWYIDDIEFVSILNVDENLDSDDQILVYPNPAKDFLTIDFGEFEGLSNGIGIFLYNHLGEMLEIKNYDSMPQSKFKIDIRNYPSGIYYLYITNRFIIFKTHKFIIIK